MSVLFILSLLYLRHVFKYNGVSIMFASFSFSSRSMLNINHWLILFPKTWVISFPISDIGTIATKSLGPSRSHCYDPILPPGSSLPAIIACLLELLLQSNLMPMLPSTTAKCEQWQVNQSFSVWGFMLNAFLVLKEKKKRMIYRRMSP